MADDLDRSALSRRGSYNVLIALAMKERKVSFRQLGKTTGLCRMRLAKVVKDGEGTRREEDALFEALLIDPLRALLAIAIGDPEAYFGPVLETVANFTTQFAIQLGEQSEAREASFVPIRLQLITPLVNDVTARVMRHQDMCLAHNKQFLG